MFSLDPWSQQVMPPPPITVSLNKFINNVLIFDTSLDNLS